MTKSRVCPKCERDLPMTTEHWYQSVLDSLDSLFPRWCKDCQNEQNRANRQTERGREISRLSSYRQYHERGKKEKQRIYAKEYRRRPKSKEQQSQYNKAYRENNIEMVRLKDRLRYYRKKKVKSPKDLQKIAELEAELADLIETND